MSHNPTKLDLVVRVCRRQVVRAPLKILKFQLKFTFLKQEWPGTPHNTVEFIMRILQKKEIFAIQICTLTVE